MPGELAPELVEKAKEEGRQFFSGNPQDNYPNALDIYRRKMNEKHWEVGEDDEELFEYAMHPSQYEAYRSGKAKVEFKIDVAKRRAEKEKTSAPATEVALPKTPQTMTVNVDGQAYRVTVAFGDTAGEPAPAPVPAPQPAAPAPAAPAQGGKEVLSPLAAKYGAILY